MTQITEQGKLIIDSLDEIGEIKLNTTLVEDGERIFPIVVPPPPVVVFVERPARLRLDEDIADRKIISP